MEDFLYSQLIAPITRTLYGEVMIIGLFVVTTGYVQTARKMNSAVREPDFWKRAILLGMVLLFTSYAALTYQIDSASNVRPASFVEGESLRTVQAKILLIIPLELAMVTLGAGLFLVLAESPWSSGGSSSETTFQLKHELLYLFSTTGIWHACCATWWIIKTPGNCGGPDAAYHATFAFLQLLSAITWNFWRTAPSSCAQTAREWLAICVYSLLVLAVYITRTGSYIQLAVEKTLQPSG